MIAAVLHPGGELRLEERPVPAPGPGEVLVRIAAVGICGSDVAYVNGTSKFPLRAPLVMGHEAAGVLEDGTRVALSPGFSCGTCTLCLSGRDNLCADVRYLGSAATMPHVDGALQEFLVMPASHLVELPDSVSLTTGALLEPLAVTLHAVRRVAVSGCSVLVMGGGAIGQLVALVSRTLGAAQVTLSDPLPGRREMAIGAHRVLDPAELPAAERFDVVFDATGHPDAVDLGLRAADGHMVVVGNLPADYGIPSAVLSRTEPWVTGTFRFPGGLAPALDFLMTSGLAIDWLVQHTVTLDDIHGAFDRPDAPLKIHVTTSID